MGEADGRTDFLLRVLERRYNMDPATRLIVAACPPIRLEKQKRRSDLSLPRNI